MMEVSLPSHIQIRQFGVSLNEVSARAHVSAHEGVKGPVGLLGIVHGYLFENAPLGVHGGLPELIRIHLAKTFIALDGYFICALAPRSPTSRRKSDFFRKLFLALFFLFRLRLCARIPTTTA